MAAYFSLDTITTGVSNDGITEKRDVLGKLVTTSYDVAKNMFRKIHSKMSGSEIEKCSRGPVCFSFPLEDMELVQSEALNFFSTVEKVPEKVIKYVRSYTFDICMCEHKDLPSLFPYQRTGIDFAHRNKKVFIADGMGAGKTAVALLAASLSKTETEVVVIITPAILRFTWRNEIKKWLNVSDNGICMVLSEKDLPITETHRYVILSYNFLCKEKILPHINDVKFFIFDEAHFLKNGKSKRTKAALKLTKKADRVYLLSGTPFNKAVELYTFLQILAPEVYSGNMWRNGFVQRYCDPQPSFNSSVSLNGCDHPGELSAILRSFMICRRKADILPFLPEKTRILIQLPEPTTNEAKEIQELLDTPENERYQNGDPFMQAWRLTSKVKMEKVVSYIRFQVPEIIAEQRKFIIFTHHTIMREAIEKELQKQNVSFFSIYGGVPEHKRAEYQREFQETEKYHGAVLSLQAACTGLTLHRASVVIMSEIAFGPDVMEQAEDRAHRIGQENKVQIYYLSLPKSTDVITIGLVMKKQRQSEQIIHGETRPWVLKSQNSDTVTGHKRKNTDEEN